MGGVLAWLAGFLQFLLLLGQIFPQALKIMDTWNNFQGKRLDRDKRKKLAQAIKEAVDEAVEDKDTARIERLLKQLAVPETPSDQQGSP
jgi:hypothetical protein